MVALTVLLRFGTVSVMSGRLHERLRWLQSKRGHFPNKVVGTRSQPQLVGNSIRREKCAQGVSIFVQSSVSFVSRMLVALGGVWTRGQPSHREEFRPVAELATNRLRAP